MEQKCIEISQSEPFSKGGNRLCFVSPSNPNVCLKVHQIDRTPKHRRQRKSFPANIRPLSFYDENRQEHRSLLRHFKDFPQTICQHLPTSYGMVETDLGTAHAMELVRDSDGLISQTVELYIWENGLDATIKNALNTFKEHWLSAPPRSRDLLPHNLVLRKSSTESTIIIIDGYGRHPKSILFGYARESKTIQRFDKLNQRIEEVLRRRASNSPKERLSNLNREL